MLIQGPKEKGKYIHCPSPLLLIQFRLATEMARDDHINQQLHIAMNLFSIWPSPEPWPMTSSLTK